MNLLIVLGIVLTLCGRVITRRWYNPLSVYSFVWTFGLLMYSLQFLPFYEITEKALVYILIGWLALLLGFTGTYVLFRDTFMRYIYSSFKIPTSCKLYAVIIIILTGISSISILYSFISVITIFGGIINVVNNLHGVFLLRISGDLPSIPYLWSFALAASFYAGIYTSLKQRINLVSLIPLILIAINSIIGASRIGMVMALILWVTPIVYLYGNVGKKKESKLIGRAVIIPFGIVLFIIMLVSARRGLVSEFPGMHEILIAMRNYIPFFPSLYYYIAHPPVVFSESIRLGEHGLFPTGVFTFRWIFNVLSKLGIVDPPPSFGMLGQSTFPLIDVGVEFAPTGSWLRPFYIDFGLLGILAFPLGIGMLLGFLAATISKRPNLIHLSLFAHLMIVVMLSFSWNVMQYGYWVQSLFMSLAIAAILSMTHSRQYLKRQGGSLC